MPIFVNSANQCLVYAHIPKTGGTWLKSVVNSDVKVLFDCEFKKELPCPPQHFHHELLQRLGLLNFDCEQFTVTRHPISRFISEFSYRQKLERKFKWMSLTTFVFFTTKAYSHNSYMLGNHIRPQADFIGSETKVFALENGLNSVVETYPQFFDLNKIRDQRVNKSNSEQVSIDPRALAHLLTFYKMDMANLAYDQPEVLVHQESFLLFQVRKLSAFLMYVAYRLFK